MRAHFECPICLALYQIEYSLADVQGSTWPPECAGDGCGFPVLVLAPQPGDYKIDLRSDGEGSSKRAKFQVSRQVPTSLGLTQVTETVSSTRQMRQIEHDSERRYANGEGEPLRFRAFSQDHSQMGDSAYGKEGSIGGRSYDSGKTPEKKRNISVRRHGQDQPDIPTHRIGGTTALGD